MIGLLCEISTIIYKRMRGYSSWNITEEASPDQVTWNEQANREVHKKSDAKVDIAEVFNAYKHFQKSEVVKQTALFHSSNLSSEYDSNIYFKREDHQRGNTAAT